MSDSFRPDLPQYPKSGGNILPIIFGILRRILWLVKFFVKGPPSAPHT